MRSLPILLSLCVAVCSAYPLDRAARDKEDSMELVQVIKGGGPHIPDGPVGKLALLSVYKACTELLELTMYEVQTQSYTVLHMERVSVSLIWASPFILEGTKARDIRY